MGSLGALCNGSQVSGVPLTNGTRIFGNGTQASILLRNSPGDSKQAKGENQCYALKHLGGVLRALWESMNTTDVIVLRILEFPLWLSRLRTWLVSMRMWVWSLASLSELRIWCCHELWYRWQTRLGSCIACLWLAAVALIRPLAWELAYACCRCGL